MVLGSLWILVGVLCVKLHWPGPKSHDRWSRVYWDASEFSGFLFLSFSMGRFWDGLSERTSTTISSRQSPVIILMELRRNLTFELCQPEWFPLSSRYHPYIKPYRTYPPCPNRWTDCNFWSQCSFHMLYSNVYLLFSTYSFLWSHLELVSESNQS